MKKIIRYLPLAVALVTFASCSSDDSEDRVVDNSKELKVFASIFDGGSNTVTARSRAAGTTWDSGDAIGITGNDYNNVKYVTSGNGSFTHSAGGPVFFSNKNVGNIAEYVAYYPFSGTAGNALGESDKVNINTSTQTPAAQKGYDILVAKASNAANSNAVNFVFHHKMASLTFVFVRSEHLKANYPDLKNLQFTLSGLHHFGSFNPADTTITVNTDIRSEVSYTMSDASDGTTNNAETQVTKQFIVLPQAAYTPTIANFTLKLADPDYSSKTFSGTFSIPALQAGMNCTITVTVDMPSLTFSTSSITAWGSAGSIGTVTASV
jgi:hypothetical protein